ncbi:MAG TPA: alpha-glucan family phosphorylase, partial [bacterium]|nr:alpha-glucan family phosphorylase [bacterium]
MRIKPRSYPGLLPTGDKPRVAYFCMEYGIHEEFPIYAGGLGVLAGDFVKSASDLGVPVCALGLLWRQGYVSQKIGPDGMPVDEYPANNPEFLDDTGVRVHVRILSREVELRVWKVNRYKIAPLFLLDTVDFNDHWINQRLYDPRPDCRLAQEMVLGVGGVRALRKLGIEVDLLHFNEGHAVFAGVEQVADRMATGLTFEEAVEWARQRIVFTTHTPVPAGNEIHPLKDLRRVGATLELVDSELTQIGGNPFSMTVAGLRLSHSANAVAQLHGETARQMWKDVSSAAPILAITNGVHVPTWQDERIREAAKKGESALLEAHGVLKRELVQLVSERNGQRLDPDRPIIGFARRAATYKRANLILRDPEWLGTLVRKYGVQLVFSGKAHPADVTGKKLLQEIVKYSREWPEAI